MSKKFTLSFKNTKKDNELLKAINLLEEKSQTIKDILYKFLCGGNKND